MRCCVTANTKSHVHTTPSSQIATRPLQSLDTGVGDGVQGLHVVALDETASTGLLGKALQLDLLSGGLGLLSSPVVVSNTVQEIQSALGVLHVLSADEDALANKLVHLDTNGMGSDPM